jgi:hypothetical protein
MPTSYSGVWRAGNDAHYLWANASWTSFRAKWEELNSQNLRLADLNINVVGSEPKFSGVWRAGAGAHYLWVNATWDSFRAKWQELAAQNLRLTVLKVYSVGGQRRFAGVWRAGSDAHYLWVGVDWENFRAKWQELSAQNLRLVDFEAYEVNGQLRYAGAWRAGTGAHYFWANASWTSFRSKWQELSALGLRLTVIKSYFSGGQRRWAGVWRPGTDGHYLWANVRWENFVSKWRELNAKGLRLVHFDAIEAASVPTTPWVRLHIKTLTAPNIAINQMVENMRQVYNAAGIEVDVASTETLNLPALNDLDVGTCTRGNTTAEQNQLFANRNNVGANNIPVYFVRSTVPPYNGCAAHQAGIPACVVAQGATGWTLAHEVGHVLGLNHVNDNNRLMTGNGTSNITNPPPDLVSDEVTTMNISPLTLDL